MFIGDKAVESSINPLLPGSETDPDYTKVEVLYKDGTKDTFGQKMFDAIHTSDPVDLTTLRDIYAKLIAGDILRVLVEWDIKWMDYDAIDAYVRNSLHESSRVATAKLYGGKESNQVRMSDLDKLLKQ